MDAVSPLPALLATLAALLTAALIARRTGAPPAHGRFGTIDGLRGFLAFFVYLHHACIWFFYLRQGEWRLPPSRLYTHFGQSSVAMFFMITGFLFFSKILDAGPKPLDWLRLFTSRVLRLVPAYAFAMGILFLIVAILTQGTLQVPAGQLLHDLGCWIGFTIFGAPDLNGLAGTSLLIASVTWSLPYEWFFYLSLPVLALAARRTSPLPYLLLGVGGVMAFAAWRPSTQLLLAFAGGIGTALAVRREGFRRFCVRPTSAFLVLGLIALTVLGFDSAYKPGPMLLLSGAFALIGGGNSLFGLLRSPAARTLGETAYGLYLLHGLGLFVLFRFVVGPQAAQTLSPATHWGLVIGFVPALLAFCHLEFRLIEAPAMRATTAVTARLRARFRRQTG
ncbi:acyltransferase [Niveibacterium sp. SC-1]|uniref:acyltransferase family protein n=1 Tax=Niveibacterium sp. SC-1 TaxID=3135646 RepID=UPI00311F32A3